MKRDVPLARRTWLGRGAGLSRSPRPPAAKPAAPRGSVKAAVALVLAGDATPAQAARLQGLDSEHRRTVKDAAWEEAKRRVHRRDADACQACGGPGTDVHHRVRRGSGGTSDPRIAFGMANLVLLCRTCHDLCHRKRDEALRKHGFWLETGDDPAQIPVHVLMGDGLRVPFWLAADGKRSPFPPAGVAA